MIDTDARPIRPEDQAEVRDFLDQRPYENVYLEWLLTQRRSTRERFFCYRDSQRIVRGVAFYGRQIALAASSRDAIAAFAELARDFSGERMIVGPRDVAHDYWQHVQSWHRAPRLERDRQPLFVLETPPRGIRSRVIIRPARLSESSEIARNSAAMIEQELGYDPRRAAGDFFENVEQMIEQGMWWVASRDGKLCFFCHIGPHSSRTVQLQGVWTPPNMRGRGLATHALTQICQELLKIYPSVSLYVNDFNESAIRLYRKVGFTQASELATYLF